MRASTAALIFCDHLGGGNDLLALEMAAALGEHLVLDLDRVGAGALQHLDGAPHVERIAEAGVGIDHQRAGKHLADRDDVVGELGQRDEAIVGNAEEAVGDAGAGDIGRAEAAIGHDAGGERIGDARQDQRRAGLEHGAELLAGGFRHRRQWCRNGTRASMISPQGIRTTEPVVLRASTSRCACAASRSG